MSLLQRLLNLYSGITPEENFFTEVFIVALQRNPDLFGNFLKKLGLTESYKGYKIESQISLPKLEMHDMGSRPDIIITLRTQENNDLIFIESKFGSREGKNQLQRYAEQLMNKESRNKYLVYITYGFDPKEKSEIVKNISNEVNFVQLRWSEFYTLLNEFRHDSLIDEIMSFMEEKRMNENKQLSPSDLSGAFSFPRVLDFYLTSLENDVEKKFISVLGNKPKPYKDLFGQQIRQWGRFALWITTGNQFDIEVGYFFNSGAKIYPQVGVEIELADFSTQWINIVKAFKEIESHPINEFDSWFIDGDTEKPDPDVWVSLKLFRPLTDFISEPDHMYSVKKRLVWCLDQVAVLKKKYPNLPWKVK